MFAELGAFLANSGIRPASRGGWKFLSVPSKVHITFHGPHKIFDITQNLKYETT